MKIKQRKIQTIKLEDQKRKWMRKVILWGPFYVIQYLFYRVTEGKMGENKEYLPTLKKDCSVFKYRGPTKEQAGGKNPQNLPKSICLYITELFVILEIKYRWQKDSRLNSRLVLHFSPANWFAFSVLRGIYFEGRPVLSLTNV